MSEVFYTVTQNLQRACTMECRRVVLIPRCMVGLNLVMGKYQQKLNTFVVSWSYNRICCKQVQHFYCTYLKHSIVVDFHNTKRFMCVIHIFCAILRNLLLFIYKTGHALLSSDKYQPEYSEVVNFFCFWPHVRKPQWLTFINKRCQFFCININKFPKFVEDRSEFIGILINTSRF